MRRLCLVLILLATYVLSASAQFCSTVDYGKGTACSLTGVNGSCTIIVDRMRAATPPDHLCPPRKHCDRESHQSPRRWRNSRWTRPQSIRRFRLTPCRLSPPLLTQLGQFALVLPEATRTHQNSKHE